MSENNELPEGLTPLGSGTQASVAPQSPALPLGAPAAVSTAMPSAVPYSPAKAISITLPDGRVVGMDKPKMSLSAAVAGVLGGLDYKNVQVYTMEKAMVKSLLYITDIDGIQEPKISDPISRAALEQKLGDEVLDTIFLVWAENFPGVDPSLLQIVKKS